MNAARAGIPKKAIVFGISIALAAGGVYAVTCAPGITEIDSGELAAVCTTAGIAHPTGYPLYTVLGWLATRLPLDVRPVLLLNFMSSLFAVGALVVFSLFLLVAYAGGCKGAVPLRRSALLKRCVVTCFGVMLLAFSEIFWSVALITEVYALHALCLLAIVLLSCKAFLVEHPQTAGPYRMAWPALLAFVLGLSFCNHSATVLVVPSVLYCAWAGRNNWKPGIGSLWLLSLCFLAGLSLYAYLPLRAAGYPELNWGNPQTLENFFWHVTAKQYRIWMFSSLESALAQSEYFVRRMLESFGYVPIAFIPFGLWYLYHCNRTVCWFSVLLFCADVFYSVNYDIKDIDAYFLPACAMCCLWMTGALVYGLSLTERKQGRRYTVLLVLACFSCAVPLVYNWKRVDRSEDTRIEQYAQAVLASCASGAVVFSYQWDYFCSPLYYLQHAEGTRSDVVLIETKLLKRSWYLEQLARNHPALTARSEGAMKRYSRELYKFEHNLPYDPAVIQKRYMDVLQDIIRKNSRDRPIYCTGEIEKEIGAWLHRVPEGFVFRLYDTDAVYRPFDYARFDLPVAGDFSRFSRYHQNLSSFYAFMLSQRGVYEMRYGHAAVAKRFFTRALSVSPGYPLARKGLDALEKAGLDQPVE